MAAESQDGGLPGLTPEELELLKKVFSSPLDIPTEWKAWIVSYLEANPPDLPINQSIGFDNLVKSAIDNANAAASAASTAAAAAQAAADAASAEIFHPATSVLETETHFTSTSYTTISSGPALTGLDNGVYVVWFGASIFANNGDTVHMAIEPNSTSGSITSALEVQGLVITEHDGPTATVAGGHVSASRVVTVTLAAGAGANRLDAVYKTDLGHDCDQRAGFITAMKVSS